MNSYTYPPNDIRKIMYNFLLKVEKEYDDDCCKKQFENAKSICNNLNRKTNFYEFLMCLKRTKYMKTFIDRFISEWNGNIENE